MGSFTAGKLQNNLPRGKAPSSRAQVRGLCLDIQCSCSFTILFYFILFNSTVEEGVSRSWVQVQHSIYFHREFDAQLVFSALESSPLRFYGSCWTPGPLLPFGKMLCSMWQNIFFSRFKNVAFQSYPTSPSSSTVKCRKGSSLPSLY